MCVCVLVWTDSECMHIADLCYPAPLPQVVDGGRHLYIVTEYASGGEVFGEFPCAVDLCQVQVLLS